MKFGLGFSSKYPPINGAVFLIMRSYLHDDGHEVITRSAATW